MKPRLLIVDDEVAHMQALCDTLEDHGYETVGCQNGEAALAALQSSPFDLLLADLMMPGMSGMVFYDAVRSFSSELAERVVFMTGGAFTSESHEFLNKHPDAWLEKPFDIRVLRELIRTRATDAETA
jgi:CheY-like chemotaxis protein